MTCRRWGFQSVDPDRPGQVLTDTGASDMGFAVSSILKASFAGTGLSLVHVPVYFGPDPLGGLGNYGAWNVGEWTAQVQRQIEKTLI